MDEYSLEIPEFFDGSNEAPYSYDCFECDNTGVLGILLRDGESLGYVCKTCWDDGYDPYPLDWAMDGGEVYELCSPEGAPLRQRLVAEGGITQEEANIMVVGGDIDLAKLQFATHGYWPDWRRRAGEPRK